MAETPKKPDDPLAYLASTGRGPPHPLPVDNSENLRQTLDRVHAETEARNAKTAEQVAGAERPSGERPGTKTLDYIALGLLLAPPAVVLDMYLKDTAINWRKLAIATPVCWLAGALVVLASHGWQSWRSTNASVLPYLIAAENKFWGKAVIIAVAMVGALALSSFLSVTADHGGVYAEPPAGFTQQQVDEKIATALEADRAKRTATPSNQATETPSMSAAAVVSLMRELQQSYSMNVEDKNQRYLTITAPPEQVELRRVLGEIIELALKPNVLILTPPDPNRELDAPKLPTPTTDGLVTHGSDRLSGVLESVLQRCFVMKRERAGPPVELGDYFYPNQHPIIIWLAIGGTGSPWRSANGCR